MTIVLFKIETGEQLSTHRTEDAARKSMTLANKELGWVRQARSWTDGIEREWGSDPAGEKSYAPYGITELERWEARFRPEFVQQRRETYVQDEIFQGM